MGIPSAVVACEGFVQTATLTAEGEGVFGLPIIKYPGHAAVDSAETLRKKTKDFILPAVVKAWTQMPKGAEPAAGKPQAYKDIVFRGTSDEVNAFFYGKGWGDGLPIIPPTLERVEKFLKYTPLPPETSFGTLPPEFRESTVWIVAVNGVIAGCRPEYMPVLVAIAEALTDSRYRIQDAGSTSSWEPIIVLNGPLIQQLGFNAGVGMFRAGNQANISVQRFIKLYMRNIAGFRSGMSDKSAFGRNTFPLVFVEDEVNSPWAPIGASSFGFKPGSNIVIACGFQSMSKMIQPSTDDPKEMLDKLAVLLTIGLLDKGHMSLGFGPEIHDALVITPIIANVIAEKYSKSEAQQYLFEHARATAKEWDRRIFAEDRGSIIARAQSAGPAWEEFRKALALTNNDPNTLLPLYHKADELFILVGGDYARNRAFVMGGVGNMGLATAKEVRLPKNWSALVPAVLP